MKKFYITLSLLTAMLVWGCAKEESVDKAEKPAEITTGKFDFRTTEVCRLNVDYNLTGYYPESKIIFEVYSENPYNTESLVSTKKS